MQALEIAPHAQRAHPTAEHFLPAKPAMTSSAFASDTVLPLPRSVRWLAYFGFFIGVGVFLAVAELQHYLRTGGQHPWEPFLWEISSAITTALLVLGLYRWHRFLVENPHPWWQVVIGHLAGMVVYILAHSAGMYGLRAIVYAITGVNYDPGGLLEVLAYEGSKDVVFYALLVAICHGALLVARDQRHRTDMARLSSELQRARLERLQEQIQPHFLFNTLNLVSSVMHEDVERADQILAELADLLRNSLDASNAQTHRLADELRIVRPFLSIMRQRFGPRLQVEIMITDEAAECLVPSLLLMAPVENAIKHGVAQTKDTVRVSISADVASQQLNIRVLDSAGQLTADSRAGGLGLSNLRERLAVLYGDAASVSLTMADGHTDLRLSVPASRA